MDVLDLNADLDDNTLLQIKMIMAKAVDTYHALYTSGKWHINHTHLSLVVCWNYGKEGHTYQHYKKPWDQVKIYNAKKKFEEKKYGGNGHKKWEENPNAIAPDTKAEGDRSNSNNKPSISPTILPEEDSSKIVADKTMTATIFTKLERNTTIKETAEIVAAFRPSFIWKISTTRIFVRDY